MTRFLLILWMGLVFQAFGQGTILFNNRIGPIDVPIRRGDGSGAGAGVTAQLFLIQRAGGEAFYLPLFPTTTFRTTSPSAAFYLNQVTVTVPGIPAGEFAEVFMRVWDGPSFESAVLVKGESDTLTVGPLGGLPSNGGPPLPDALLIGLVMIVPEPSISALVLLGTLILTGRKREKELIRRQPSSASGG